MSEEYYIYLRKSRADKEAEAHGEGETLARHESILINLAKKKKLHVTKIYREIVSGESIASRPEVQNLINDIQAGNCAGVLVMEIERLARGDTIDQGIVAQAFKFSNTKIITPVKTYDPLNEFDEEYFEFGLFMSRREYKTINRRIQQGRVASIKEGKYVSSIPPFGYDRIKLKNEKGYSLIPDKKNAEIINQIFDLYVNGITHNDGTYEEMGSYRIANYLNALCVKPMRNGSWTASSIRDIIKNPVYIGKICWQKRKEVKKIVDGKVKKSHPNSQNYLMYDGLHPGIVSEEIFYKAQNIMSTHVKTPLKESSVLQNPFAGLFYCKKCGSLMTRLGINSKNKYATLKCPNRICDNISAPIFLIEEVLIKSLEDWLEKYKLQIKDSESNLPPSSVCIVDNSIISLNDELRDLEKQITKTYEFLEKEIYTTDVFLDRNKKLKEQSDLVNEQINMLENKRKMITKREIAKQRLIPTVTSVISSYYDCDTAEAKNNLLKEVIEKVTYIKNERNTRSTLLNANFELELFPKLPR